MTLSAQWGNQHRSTVSHTKALEMVYSGRTSSLIERRQGPLTIYQLSLDSGGELPAHGFL